MDIGVQLTILNRVSSLQQHTNTLQHLGIGRLKTDGDLVLLERITIGELQSLSSLKLDKLDGN